MSGLKLYYDLMSQPSRALYLFLRMNNIQYTDKLLALRKGEHLTPEYGKINPFHRVPVIEDDGFVLTESVAILRYLSDKYNVADHWYPRNLQKRAKVDEYMAWQHWHTRMHAAFWFRVKVIEPRMKQTPVDQEKLGKYKEELEMTMDFLENVFLKDNNYLCGDQISIADILGVCELMQPYSAGYDVSEGREKLTAWMQRVKARLQPHFDEAHKQIYRMHDNLKSSKI